MKILEFDVKTGNAMYRDMTAEEIAEKEQMTEREEVIVQPSAEERLDALELALLELAEVMTNG